MAADDPVHVEGVPLGGVQGSPLHTLGKYRLIAKLARGGMGVLYLAVLRGMGGFQKLVAVKELRPDLADDDALVAMFLDEARLAARLNHPNIVQTIEVGTTAGRHFMAMEYLEGQSLQRVVHRAQERGTPVPLGMHLGIHLDLLAALDYAHRLTSFDGAPLGVVHQDVSPHNVFVTYEGQIKLVDFGVAKALDGLESSRTGLLKGKTRYMSPEQAACGPVDPRADLFSVGVLLWEAIVGRRPWDGRSDNSVLESLVHGVVPRVRDARPDLDADLAAIVDRAMSTDPAGRYGSAQEMREDLEHYMDARSMGRLHTRALSALVLRLFADDRQRLRDLVDAQLRAVDGEAVRRSSSSPPTQTTMSVPVGEDDRDLAEAVEPDRGPSAQPPRGSRDEAPPPADAMGPPSLAPATVRSAAPLALSVDRDPIPSVAPETLLSPPPSRVSRGFLIAGAAVLGATVALAAFAIGRSSAVALAPSPAPVHEKPPVAVAAPAPPRPAHVVVRASPASAQIFLDDVEVGNPYVADRVRDGATHALFVEATGYESKNSTVSFAADIDVAIDLAVASPSPGARPRVAGGSRGSASPDAPASPASASGAAAPLPPAGPKPIETGDPYAR